jgi:hypothetical protein
VNHGYSGRSDDPGGLSLWAAPTLGYEADSGVTITTPYPLSDGNTGTTAGTSFGWIKYSSANGTAWGEGEWDTAVGGPWTPSNSFVGDMDTQQDPEKPWVKIQMVWGDGSPASHMSTPFGATP